MAWTYVGISSVASAASDNITLTEPAGVQQGDLCVAIISYRSNAAFTKPSADWTDVTSQNTGNTTANGTGSIGSGLMSYYIRGSSAPSLVFTRTAGNVALGRIVAYRGQATSGLLVTSTSTTLAAAATAVSVAGVTTSNARDLIVFGACGARNGSFSNFDAATNPTTTSGTASNETGNPAEGDWQERADSGTTTGADCTLAIADALRATAGVSGNLTVTASSSARHVVVAAVFKERATNALTATGVTTGTPAVDAPALGQVHVLTAPSLASSEPATDSPALGQVHVLVAGEVSAGAPVLGAPELTEASTVDDLLAEDINASTPILGAPALGQVHVLGAGEVATSPSNLGSPALAQTHVIQAVEISAGAPALSAPAITQVHSLAVSPLSSGEPSLGTPALQQVHALETSGVVAGEPVLGAPAVSEAVPAALVALDIAAGAPVLGAPTLRLVHSLSAEELVLGAPRTGFPAIVSAPWAGIRNRAIGATPGSARGRGVRAPWSAPRSNAPWAALRTRRS